MRVDTVSEPCGHQGRSLSLNSLNRNVIQVDGQYCIGHTVQRGSSVNFQIGTRNLVLRLEGQVNGGAAVYLRKLSDGTVQPSVLQQM